MIRSCRVAKRAEQNRALDDLAGPRIGDRLSVGPAARRAVDPVHDIVADVERVGACGQDADLEGILEARPRRTPRPPAHPVLQRGSDRLGRAAVDVEDDRLFDRRACRGGIDLLEAEAAREIVDDRLLRAALRNRPSEGRSYSRTGSVRCDVARLGQRDQRMAKHERQRVAVDDIADLRLRFVRAEGQLRGEFGILRENLHEVGVGGAELRDELEIAAAAVLDRTARYRGRRARGSSARSTVYEPSLAVFSTSPIHKVEVANDVSTACCSSGSPLEATNLLFSTSAATFLPIRRKTRIRVSLADARSSPIGAEPRPVPSCVR